MKTLAEMQRELVEVEACAVDSYANIVDCLYAAVLYRDIAAWEAWGRDLASRNCQQSGWVRFLYWLREKLFGPEHAM